MSEVAIQRFQITVPNVLLEQRNRHTVQQVKRGKRPAKFVQAPVGADRMLGAALPFLIDTVAAIQSGLESDPLTDVEEVSLLPSV